MTKTRTEGLIASIEEELVEPNEVLAIEVMKSCRLASNRGLSDEQIGCTLLQAAMAMLLTCVSREETAQMILSLAEE